MSILAHETTNPLADVATRARLSGARSCDRVPAPPCRAEWIVNRLVENNARSLPEDFLAYHQSTLSPYHGMRGPVVVETDEYPSAEVTLPPKTSPV